MLTELRDPTQGTDTTTPEAGITPGRGETILVADDDDIVRPAIAASLRRLGYRVLEAATGLEAVRLAAACERPIHLVLADVVMPSLTVDELANRMRTVQPDARLVFMSGYIHDPAVRRRVLHGVAPFLEKPFSIGQLSRAIRRHLESSAA